MHMIKELKISIGQYSDKGRKKINQDFHGVSTPLEPLLTSKGIAIAISDGISSSDVSQIASEAAVKGFLSDYFDTPEAWSVKKSAQRVIAASNSWLFSQSQQGLYRYNKDKGYVCTLSAMIIKSTTAHLFHVGDARIYQIHSGSFEQLTEDHRLWVSEEKSHLSRALGVSQQVDIDYRTLAVEVGDVFLLATDGVYEYVNAAFVNGSISKHKTNLDQAAKEIVDEALKQGSTDNLTVQIIRLDELPTQDAGEMYQQLTTLPFPPELEAGVDFDGYKIIKKVHSSSRSHVYLARDLETKEPLILKVPSIDLRGDAAYLERFFMEEWVGRRLDNAHVLKSCAQTRKKNYLYIVTEYIEGTTLAQWMVDNPQPNMETVRGIIEQVAKGLRAFHRQEMLHQDLRPANIMINNEGVVKIIDFGSTQVAGLAEIATPLEQVHLLGTAQYTAPEYFLGAPGTPKSDLFSLGVITYQLLTGKLPYGAEVAKSTTRSAQNKLKYQSALHKDRAIPAWVDEVIKKAVHPNPNSRYEELTEFVYNLRRPSKEFVSKAKAPLLDRNPVLFWKGVSLGLLVVVIGLLTR